MDNRIRQIDVRDRSLVPAEAEVWIRVTPEQQTPTTELRGRLMGPRCLYASTIEVAYPLRSLPPDRAAESPGLTKRVVVPEACLWEPESPFLYEGPIELWQDGQRRDRRTLRHGLRSFRLDERGLRVNGRLLMLHGRWVTACSEQDMRALRQAGCNLLLAAVEESTLPLWEQADRLGFLVLGCVPKNDALTGERLEALSRHASCLGWLVNEVETLPIPSLPRGSFLGLLCDAAPSKSSLAAVHFLVGPAELANLGKPLLVKGDMPDAPAEAGAILGRIG